LGEKKKKKREKKWSPAKSDFRQFAFIFLLLLFGWFFCGDLPLTISLRDLAGAATPPNYQLPL
jgi:hypothetical protein